MNDSPFRALTTLRQLEPQRFAAHIDPTWTIGPKVHGGSMTAVVGAAARDAARANPDVVATTPVAISTDFVSAPEPGPVELDTEFRKIGKQVSLVDVVLRQGDRVAVRASVTLGAPDDGEPLFADVPTQLPAEPPEDAVTLTPEHPMAQVVHVAQGSDMRVDPSSAHFLRGAQGDPEVRLWARPLAGDDADVDARTLFAVMTGDISAPVTMNRGMFGWAPTVQLTTYVRRVPAPGWLRVVARSSVLGATWFEEDHTVIDSTGAVVVQSRQLAMIPR
ncbi:thioesterase family protein [Rhodococcus sp. HNM0569]|uniref:thioesterase family protein n=1 Tax=Rhodococcus sp. HNM0569 TaxID=2716340 RepID=UPI00146A238C|nr:thioesterase family protein [Rhodococcus sp. HNM0569]NLU84109.1 thioesterase family protein [Rhodococcus sp. HNM0569]